MKNDNDMETVFLYGLNASFANITCLDSLYTYTKGCLK